MTRPDVLTTANGAPALMVLLPGALMTPQHMVDAGLFDAVTRRSLALELMAVDLHALGTGQEAALRVLVEDVLAPARATHEQVWLTGISRGGQLALSCVAEQAAVVDGLCLLAPYPGSRLTTNAIQRAGGLDAWRPTDTTLQDPEYRMWHGLRQTRVDVPLFLGVGRQDRFIDGIEQLAAALPTAEYALVDGGHDWAAWLPLWERFLDAGHFRSMVS